MIIGILQTGRPPSSLEPRFGGYPGMFAALLGEGFDYAVFDAEAGELPASPEACNAYLITGSSAGAYDDLPWISPLETFLREAKGRAKLVGVCFGHQIMAQAFGGQVEKSERGWGVGLQTYQVWSPAAWMTDSRPVSVAVSHQDQVTVLPCGGRAIGGSSFSPHGLIAYEDQPAISMQFHPEFTADFAKALLEAPWATAALADRVLAAIGSLDAPSDRQRVGDWIRAFLLGKP